MPTATSTPAKYRRTKGATYTSKDHTQIRPNRRHGATSDEARLTSETAEVIIEALARAA